MRWRAVDTRMSVEDYLLGWGVVGGIWHERWRYSIGGYDVETYFPISAHLGVGDLLGYGARGTDTTATGKRIQCRDYLLVRVLGIVCLVQKSLTFTLAFYVFSSMACSEQVFGHAHPMIYTQPRPPRPDLILASTGINSLPSTFSWLPSAIPFCQPILSISLRPKLLSDISGADAPTT